ncbi:MAG: type II toxin-antitoxin system PemK/MazF family toxin [Betaproteobacteria bacterium]|nr:type II toxin-antitoxin system PemK/MazF family toxin [Betaproteobacteria bacterium]
MTNSSSSRFEAGDIIEIYMPFADGEGGKKRPVLIVSTPDSRADFLALSISSAGHHPNTLSLPIHELASGRLSKASFIRADKVIPVNAEAVSQLFGRVKPAFLDKARKQMCAALGCR